MKPILKLKSDAVFKRLFGDPRNAHILKKFLCSVLGIEASNIKRLDIIDPISKIEKRKDKTSILDIKIETETQIMNVEIQLDYFKFMEERIVYGAARSLFSQLKKGENYGILKKTIVIIIADYNLKKEAKEYHDIFRLISNKTNTIFSDIIEIHTLELKKLPKAHDGKELYEWLKFISAEEEKEMEAQAVNNKEINEAYGILKKLSEDEALQMIEFYEERARMDDIARIEYALEKGEQEGAKKIINYLKEGHSLEEAEKLLMADFKKGLSE